MRVWRRVFGHGLSAIVGGVAVAAYMNSDRMAFVGKCYANGNALGSCVCTVSALSDLSVSYRDLAKSWATDPSGAYSQSVLYSIARETLKSATGISADLSGGATAKTYTEWLQAASRLANWRHSTKMIEGTAQVLATTAKVSTVIVPVVLAGTELQNARNTMSQSCGDNAHFLSPIDNISSAVVLTASDSTNWVMKKTSEIGDGAADAAAVGSDIATSSIRKLRDWLGLGEANKTSENSENKK